VYTVAGFSPKTVKNGFDADSSTQAEKNHRLGGLKSTLRITKGTWQKDVQNQAERRAPNTSLHIQQIEDHSTLRGQYFWTNSQNIQDDDDKERRRRRKKGELT
jgi:hypothetical protein